MPTVAATAKRAENDLAALEKFDRVYKHQQQAISRRLLGTNPAINRAVAYLSDEEFAEATRLNVSTLSTSQYQC